MNIAAEQVQRQQMMALLQQQNPQGIEESRTQSGTTPAYFSLDVNSAAKQMAALNATSQHRRASQSGGTSDTLFGPRQPPLDSVSDATAAGTQVNKGPIMAAQALKTRRDEFLKFVAGVMNARHTPLPSTITGIPSAYDPATSRWKSIESTAEPGGFRLAGKDVDLFKLWQLVLSHGGHAKLTREFGWNTVLSHFGLPEELPASQANGSASVSHIIAQYYMALLAPFEEVYLRNMQQQQQKALQARQQQQQQGAVAFQSNNAVDPSSTGLPSQQSQLHGQALSTGLHAVTSLPLHARPDILQQASGAIFKHEQLPASPLHSMDTVMTAQQLPGILAMPHAHTHTPTPQASDISSTSMENNSRRGNSGVGAPVMPHSGNTSNEIDKKRKPQEEELGKRVRQRTDPSITGQQIESTTNPMQGGPHLDNQSQMVGHAHMSTPSRPSTASASPLRQSRLRRKIEYTPLARQLDTYGGRDLEMIDAEFAKVTARRPQRHVDEWGTVDIDGLTMSLRSRLPTELSYAITVLSVLSTMRGQSPDTGFSLHQCDDLLDELLDLLKEQAFEEAEDVYDEPETFWTYRELITLVRDNELQTFSDFPRTKSPAAHGLKPSRTDIVFAILNLFRNFSLTGENQRFMGQHTDVLNLLLRVCSISTCSPGVTRRLPSPATTVLSLPEVIRARRDVLTIVSNIVPFTNLASHASRTRARLFELLASFLVEPHDLSSPSGIVTQSGAISAGTVRPPLVVDLALEAFSKLAQPDANRLALSREIKFPWLWSLFSSLVHRLPVSNEDFAITMRMHDVWLSYVEKVVLSVYSICFLASPELKAKIKMDRTLGFPKLILRMVKRFVSINHPDARQYFLVSSRRAVEALKLIDEGNDAFESPQSNGPMFAFGVGFGESDPKQKETGVGLLAAFQDDVTWSIMMMPHLDDVMFAELDSLSRIHV